jgi:two-component system cell cycle sensor histidine kinase/response regulator CckA
MKTIGEFSPSTPGQDTAIASVLVVDDEIAVRRFATRVLQREGYRVLEAADGVEALEMLNNGAAGIEVVVSDVVMPRLNGVELTRELSSLRPGLPVLLMSGYATGALNDLGIAVPCGIIPKPFSAERLVTEVQRCLGSKK